MKVCIAEKPSVAKEIAQILGANTRRDGYFEGNDYAVTWTFGHLCTLYTPDDYKPHWKRWDFNTLPMLPERFETKIIDNPGIQKQFHIVKSLFDKADVVINCGDAGQEGELIQRWVINKAGYDGPVERLWISSLTSEAIKDGFKHLKSAEQYDTLFHAGSSRAIGDWLLGMNATRLYTLKYGRDRQVLSIGRVQTPTLALVVERFLEIRDFQPKPYWELQTEYRDTLFTFEKGRFLDKIKGESVLRSIEKEEFEILEVKHKKGKELPPPLFDLTSLQVYCNTKFNYSADQTLKIAQSLYEKKAITYPRVDTTYLPLDLYPKIPNILRGLKSFETLTRALLQEPIKKSKKVFDDKKVTDHHAIIPTGYEVGLSSLEQPVFEIITKRFIAAFYPDCILANTNVKAKVDRYEFKASGKVIQEAGWRTVLSSKSNDKLLPDFSKGEKGTHIPSFSEKMTSPPKYFTEATLLRAMETAGKRVDDEDLRELMKANGIGRPSTRANIIETLFKRKYVEKQKKNLVPTSVGTQLIQTINNDLLKSAELTGQWERKLKDIETGKYSAAKFIREMKQMVDDLVVEVRMEQSRGIRQSSEKPAEIKKTKSVLAGIPCPKCKSGTLLKGKENIGCSNYKEGCDFGLPMVFLKKKISDTQFKKILTKGKSDSLKGFVTPDGKQSGLLRLDHDFKLIFENSEKDLACPKCKEGKVLKGKTAFGCSEYQKTCDFVMPFDKIKSLADGRKLNKELVRELISNCI